MGEGLLRRCAAHPSGATNGVVSLRSTQTLGSKLLILPVGEYETVNVSWGDNVKIRMVVGEGLLRRCAAHPSGATNGVVSLRSTQTFGSKLLILPVGEYETVNVSWGGNVKIRMVVGEGFEPSKSMTADLQSAPFGRSGTPPGEAC